MTPSQPTPTSDDRGLLLGDGLFETIPLHGGRPHGLDLHLDRFRSGARALGLEPPSATQLQEGVRRALAELVPAPGAPSVRPDGRLRLTLTAGSGGAGGLARPPGGEPMLQVVAAGFRSDPAWWTEGLRAVRAGRVDPESLVARSGAKHTNYLERILALRTARGAGAHEALLSTPSGELVEGSASALLWWDGARLHLPRAGALPSLTIQLLREELDGEDPGEVGWGDRALDGPALESILAGPEGPPGSPLPPRPSGEIMLASRLRQLVPVVEVDGRAVGSGRPGPVFRRLQQLYLERVRSDLGLPGDSVRGR
ncbi:MAG: hypothetical protein EA352_11990 [Gemmatimonadales bacterium]|nr:MAG: hypothetical protein EA352_11990 [Gemmatimonadales bacterium]